MDTYEDNMDTDNGAVKATRYTVFVGNLDRRTTATEVRREFEAKGFKIDSLDVKDGFSFVYFTNERDAEDAVREFEGREWHGKRLRVEHARGDGHIKKREEERRKKQDPTDTLFVVNYDPQRTRQSDLEDFFKKYGDVRSVRIMKNYAFVQFNTVADATNARENGNGRSLGDRNLSVEYSVAPSRGEDDGGRRDRRRSPPPRRRDRSPRRNYRDEPYSRDGGRRRGGSPVGYSRRRSQSPPRRRDDRDRRDRYRDNSPPRRERSPVRRQRTPSPRQERSPVRGSPNRED